MDDFETKLYLNLYMNTETFIYFIHSFIYLFIYDYIKCFYY